jgi:hypothetical protein
MAREKSHILSPLAQKEQERDNNTSNMDHIQS